MLRVVTLGRKISDQSQSLSVTQDHISKSPRKYCLYPTLRQRLLELPFELVERSLGWEMSSCLQCGNEIKEGSAFCSSCGAKAGHATETAFCWSCGKELDDGVVFCSGCGAKAGDVPEAVQAIAVPVQTGRANCQYCNGIGTVVVQQVKRKKGVSPGKIAGAVVTGGISLVGTGVAKKVWMNQLTCTACQMKWYV